MKLLIMQFSPISCHFIYDLSVLLCTLSYILPICVLPWTSHTKLRGQFSASHIVQNIKAKLGQVRRCWSVHRSLMATVRGKWGSGRRDLPNLTSTVVLFIAVTSPFYYYYFYLFMRLELPPLWSVMRLTGCRSRGPGFDFRRYHIFWVVVGLKWGPLILVRINNELLERKISGFGLENWD
jgi:hypothetical protein